MQQDAKIEVQVKKNNWDKALLEAQIDFIQKYKEAVGIEVAKGLNNAMQQTGPQRSYAKKKAALRKGIGKSSISPPPDLDFEFSIKYINGEYWIYNQSPASSAAFLVIKAKTILEVLEGLQIVLEGYYGEE